MAENKPGQLFQRYGCEHQGHQSFWPCVVVLYSDSCRLHRGLSGPGMKIAEHNTKENQLKKLREDLLNSLEAAGAISRQLSFLNGKMSFVGDLEKVLHKNSSGNRKYQ